MAERFLMSARYKDFPNEFRFTIQDDHPSGRRHLWSRSEGRKDFATAIRTGWTDEQIIEALWAERPFDIPYHDKGIVKTFPPVEFCARVLGLPELLSPAEIGHYFSLKTSAEKDAYLKTIKVLP